MTPKLTDHQLAALLYRLLHNNDPLWVTDAPEGTEYKAAVKSERQRYEAAIKEMRKQLPKTRVVKEIPSGYISMERCRSLASTYSGSEGNHPLARHRDSMG